MKASFSPSISQALHCESGLSRWDSLMVLCRDDGKSPHQEIDFDGVFHPPTSVLITITSGPGGSSAFVDGILAETYPALKLSLLDFSGQLVLGTSPVEDDTWTGQVRGLVLYGRELSSSEIARHPGAWAQGMDPAVAAREGALALYTFEERSGDLVHDRLARSSPDLYIPRTFQLPHKPLLRVWHSDFRLRSNRKTSSSTSWASCPWAFSSAHIFQQTHPTAARSCSPSSWEPFLAWSSNYYNSMFRPASLTSPTSSPTRSEPSSAFFSIARALFNSCRTDDGRSASV